MKPLTFVAWWLVAILVGVTISAAVDSLTGWVVEAVGIVALCVIDHRISKARRAAR